MNLTPFRSLPFSFFSFLFACSLLCCLLSASVDGGFAVTGDGFAALDAITLALTQTAYLYYAKTTIKCLGVI
jgi:hypothetical protein